MKATELRIGNLVDLGNRIAKIIEIAHLACVVVDLEETQDTMEDYERVKGIPLTQEWLLKFGFEKVNSELTNIAPLNLPCTFNLPNTPFSFCQGKLILKTGTGDFCVNTEYVHQLQNLYFALTSEELTLKSEVI
jgi:hypothetical protein